MLEAPLRHLIRRFAMGFLFLVVSGGSSACAPSRCVPGCSDEHTGVICNFGPVDFACGTDTVCVAVQSNIPGRGTTVHCVPTDGGSDGSRGGDAGDAGVME
jgi:hypothetical protein